ncbi:MAG: Holliday junction branch migration DNA helicase RuvB [Candidatus Kerfeldbacteria bacterium]|nr:Holliday junction branch migration DNA helicase RuvB [Candidatus Kerfeldbacteria bacterium]
MSIEVVTTPEQKEDDKTLDATLRPAWLSEYIGQEQVKNNLHIFIAAAKTRNEPIEHVLLHGNPGLGKTTLAYIIAKEMGTNIRVTSGPAIERTGDLAAILTNLQEGDILFIDEIHRLHKTIEEILYPAMEDYVLDVIVGKGPAARTLRLELPKFTIIGATTRMSLISAPLRDRFGGQYKLELYGEDEIEQIIHRSARILSIDIDKDSAQEIARRARRTPRIANRLLKRVRDYAQVKHAGHISHAASVAALALLDVDHLGLNMVDRKLLQTIIEKFNGGPVGAQTIAAATAEEQETIEEVYEPFLMQLGFLARTPRGRVVTEHAYRHLGMHVPQNVQEKLAI